MKRLMGHFVGGCSAAALVLSLTAFSASASVIRCTGQGIDQYWKIEADSVGMWGQGEWIPVCNNHVVFMCSIQPERYYFRMTLGVPEEVQWEWSINRVDGTANVYQSKGPYTAGDRYNVACLAASEPQVQTTRF